MNSIILPTSIYCHVHACLFPLSLASSCQSSCLFVSVGGGWAAGIGYTQSAASEPRAEQREEERWLQSQMQQPRCGTISASNRMSKVSTSTRTSQDAEFVENLAVAGNKKRQHNKLSCPPEA